MLLLCNQPACWLSFLYCTHIIALFIPFAASCTHSIETLVTRTLKSLLESAKEKYGYGVVLTETFVGEQYEETCYRATNWQYAGETTGRGKYGDIKVARHTRDYSGTEPLIDKGTILIRL